MQQKGVQQLLAEKRTHQEQDHLSRLLCDIEEFCGSSDRSLPRSRDGVESTKVLGRVAILKHSFFAGPHYRAADLRARLLAVAGDTVCERRGGKADYENHQRNH